MFARPKSLDSKQTDDKIFLARALSLRTAVKVATAQIRQMVDDVEVRDGRGPSTSKIFYKKSSFPSQTVVAQAVHPCSLWEIQVCIVNSVIGRVSKTTSCFSGDYAWGREGLDTIVTQLLNQMDNAGKAA